MPVDTQARVSQYVMSKTPKQASSSQSKNANEIDTFDASEYEFNISASLMSKILEDSIQDSVTKHCGTCTCSKSQNKPFCYNDSHYTVSTQTILSGEVKNYLCLNCNAEIKSINSGFSVRSSSPTPSRIVNDRAPHSPLYIAQQPHVIEQRESSNFVMENIKPNNIINDIIKTESSMKLEADTQRELGQKVDGDNKTRNNSINMEPTVHHQLCDRTKTSISSKKSSILSACNDDLLIRDVPNGKEGKPKIPVIPNENLRKSSQSSMGAASRTSSIAKSTVSTHKSNTTVGPGPRFCHLRMQAGSKNILLDNVEPDVPPVLYRRQSKCNENSIFKDLNEGIDNFIDLEKNDDEVKNDIKDNNVVVETTLIDVHVDNNNKEPNLIVKNTTINPILLNVSSSPLQPLKTHNFSNTSEHNNNGSHIGSQKNTSEIDNLLNDFSDDINNSQTNNNTKNNESSNKNDVLASIDNSDIKIFNFDRYEQSKVSSQYTRPIKKIDMSHFHSLENTKISKDYPPLGDFDLDKKPETIKPSLPNIVNVYPNLTQTHLKVNENKKIFTNEQSTSSLSSDDSAAMLQKQQLLRVAEWVEKNLEQQNNLNDPLEDECLFPNQSMRRDSKINRLTETLNELALNVPHPVSKYSRYAREPRNNWPHNSVTAQSKEKLIKPSGSNPKIVNSVVKETIFPVEYGDDAITEINNAAKVFNRSDIANIDVGKELRDALKSKGDKEISPEDLARMEYNVKKFLLSGPYWANPGSAVRSRRTSSKTETDV